MNKDSFWYWASAGKTLTTTLVGIAEELKLLKISDRTQDYLGKDWTEMSNNQEWEIRIAHQLSMNTELNDQNGDLDITISVNLTYLADPGERWGYHYAIYNLLEKMVGNASGKSHQSYFEAQIGKKIGISDFWQKTGFNNVFFSNARSFARFGLLLQARGNWIGEKISSSKYFNTLSESSTEINRAYGYLTWLNGTSSYMLPQS